MSLLPDDLNPLTKKTPYDELNAQYNLGIGPNDTEEEISKALKKISLDKLSPETRNEKLESIKKLLKALKNPASRVRLNAFVLDKVDVKSVEDRLRNLPSLKSENMQLSKPDLAQVFKEGENLEIAQGDFAEIGKIPALEVDFNAIKAMLDKRQLEKHILFEI